MKSFLKDFNDNFWKYMVVIVLIIMLSFSIKWTNCLCSFSDAAVRYFDRNGPNEHFSNIIEGIDSTEVIEAEEDVEKANVAVVAAKAKESTAKTVEKATASAAAAAATAKIAEKRVDIVKKKAEETKSEASGFFKSLESKAKTTATGAEAEAKQKATATESAASKAATDAKNQATTTVSAAKSATTKEATDATNKATTTVSAAKSAAATKLDNDKKKLAEAQEEALLESFTSNVRTCEIKSPNNIVAGYMNSIDHDINNACNHPNPNDCSLVKSSVTGGVQYIESKSLRKSHGEFSGVTEWTKQTA